MDGGIVDEGHRIGQASVRTVEGAETRGLGPAVDPGVAAQMLVKYPVRTEGKKRSKGKKPQVAFPWASI